MKSYARIKQIAESNNAKNRNKNICALAVAKILGVDGATRDLHTWTDLSRAIRWMWSFRSVKSKVGYKRGDTVGKIRAKLKKNYGKDPKLYLYVAMTPEHVIVLGPQGQTVIDTAPKKRDVRPVLKLYGVYAPESGRGSGVKQTRIMQYAKRVANAKGLE